MVLLDNGGRARTEMEIALPPADLRGLIEHVWVQRGPHPARRWHVVPDAAPHLIAAVTESPEGRGLRVALVGPRSRAAVIEVERRVTTVGVRLRPGALPGLVRASAVELADAAVPIRTAFSCQELSELELSADAPVPVLVREMIRLVRRAARRPAPTPIADAIVRVSSVHAATGVLGMPERTLRDRVRREIGLSPKRTLRILRLHRALVLSRKRDVSWAAVAQLSGYADQPHFTRECRDLLGETPSQWISRGTADSFKTGSPFRV